MKFKIWNPDECDEEDACDKVLSHTPPPEYLQEVLRGEAESYMERNFHNWDYPSESPVSIRLGEELFRFLVEVRSEPTFHAALKK